VKFVLLLEGRTEAYICEFLGRWLNARLSKNVGFTPVHHEGWHQLVKDARIKTDLHLNHPRRGKDVIAVVGLLDLYGPDFYPPTAQTVAERYEAGKKHMEKLVGNERFFQFFAVHEIEAWLLSDPGRFRSEVRSEVNKLCSSPETIDSGNPPSKRLNELYRTKFKNATYDKVGNARNEFPKLDPEKAAEKCPYLREMLTFLLERAREAGA
jgi:hypothetical protein